MSLNATIKETAPGMWEVCVGRWLIAIKKNESDALDLQTVLARPEMYLDPTDNDFAYWEPDDMPPSTATAALKSLPKKSLNGKTQ